MLNIRQFISSIVSILLLNFVALTYTAHAHSDIDKARFVAEIGKDNSECDNRFRPCRTIAFAVKQANKGDRILVAQGSYFVDSTEALVYLVSNTYPVFGGYNVSDNYQNQSPNQFKSTLIGLPQEYAEALYDRGFHIISDAKAMQSSEASANASSSSATKSVAQVRQTLNKGLNALSLVESSQSASDCVNGSASGFSCEKLSLVGHLSLNELPTASSSANDIWGHVDLNDMREYAIIGLRNGVAVVDVSQADSPTVVGSVQGQGTTWRDIKVLQYYDPTIRRFKAYAYSVADNVVEGMMIIDLSNLPSSVSLSQRNTSDRESHNVYISNVDYTTNTALRGQSPKLHLTGTNNFGGAWRTYSLVDPANPSSANAYTNASSSRSNYTHDASSLLVDDHRAVSDCIQLVVGKCNVIIDFNESEVRLWEHNSAEEATLLSEFSYPNAQYTHSGWWSEDKQYIFVHDELDERRLSLNTTINIFEISDLRSPRLVGTWTGPTKASDHNGFVKGNKYYMSNYERGVTVLDIRHPEAPQEVAYFDSYPASNNNSFNGVWGVYPYLPSGHILASDIQGGLFILRDETIASTDNAIGFLDTQIVAQEGDRVRIEVLKQGAASMSVDYDILLPSASENDIDSTSGTLYWGANDSDSQFVEIDILPDNAEEFDELIVLSLNNATNGDILIGKSHSFLNIDGSAVDSGVLSFEQTTINALETQGRVSFKVARQNSSVGSISANVSFETSTATLGEDFELASGTSTELTWQDGDLTQRSVEIDILNDSALENAESISVVLTPNDSINKGSNLALTINIKDDDSNTAPNVTAGPDLQVNTRQTVYFNNAQASDSESELSVQWTQLEGELVSIENSNQLNARFTAPATAATLSFQISATDEFGLSSADTVTVQVVAVSQQNVDISSGSSGGTFGIYALIGLLVVAMKRGLENTQ